MHITFDMDSNNKNGSINLGAEDLYDIAFMEFIWRDEGHTQVIQHED